ncbi:MAG: pilus assembly protein N-terminal domain-containing protein [Candidatus Omnitrophota bacterium]
MKSLSIFRILYKGLFFLAVCASLLAIGTDSSAETPAGLPPMPIVKTEEPNTAQEALSVIVGELKIIPVQGVRRVAIGEPEIADISVLNQEEILLMPKAAGNTILIIWDNNGQRSIQVEVIAKETAEILSQTNQIQSLLKTLKLPRIKIKVEGGKIFLMGEVLRAADLESLQKAIAPFEKVTNLVKVTERQPMVQIDLEVLEVGKTDLKNLGVSWSQSLLYTEETPASGTLPQLMRINNWSRGALTARLNMLKEEDKARTLSNPSMLTISGKEAEMLIGGEVPIVIVDTDSRSSVEWKPYGIILKIKPTVTEKNEINTAINAEISELDWANAVSQQGFQAPSVKKRTAQTELYLNDGDTIILGGLIKNEEAKNIAKVPFLTDIPILGSIFRSTQFTTGNSELVIAVTPTIVDKDIYWDEEEKDATLSGWENEAQKKLELLKQAEEQVKQKETEARDKKNQIESQEKAEQEKMRKFADMIDVLHKETINTGQKIEALKNEQGSVTEQEEKIKEEKDKVSFYRKAEETKLKKLEEIKKLQEDLIGLMQETKGRPLPSIFEEPPAQEKKEYSEDEELARLRVLKQELSKLEKIKEKLTDVKSKEEIKQEKIKRKHVYDALEEIEKGTN